MLKVSYLFIARLTVHEMVLLCGGLATQCNHLLSSNGRFKMFLYDAGWHGGGICRLVTAFSFLAPLKLSPPTPHACPYDGRSPQRNCNLCPLVDQTKVGHYFGGKHIVNFFKRSHLIKKNLVRINIDPYIK